MWILYNSNTGGVISVHEDEPTTGPNQSKVDTNITLGGSNLFVYKWNGSEPVRNDKIWVTYSSSTGILTKLGAEKPILVAGESSAMVDHLFNTRQPLKFWKYENGSIVESGEAEEEQNDLINTLSGLFVDYDTEGNYFIRQPQRVLKKASLSRPNQSTIGLINNRNIEETYLTSEFMADRSGNYHFGGFYSFSSDDTSRDFIERISIFDVTANKYVYNETHRLEAKESGGFGDELNVLRNGSISGFDNAGTDQILRTVIDMDFDLIENHQYKYELHWRPERFGVEAAIYYAQLSAEFKPV